LKMKKKKPKTYKLSKKLTTKPHPLPLAKVKNGKKSLHTIQKFKKGRKIKPMPPSPLIGVKKCNKRI